MTTTTQASSARAWWASVREEPVVAALALYAFALPFARPPAFKVGSSEAVFADLVLVAIWLTALVRVVTRKLRLRFDALFVLGVLFVGAEVLSLVVAHKLALSTLLKLGAFAGMVMMPWLASHALVSKERVGAVMRAWFAGSLGAIGVGLLGFVAFYADRDGLGWRLMCGWGALAPQAVPRLCSPFTTPNYFENYLSASVPIALYVFKDRFTLVPSARSAIAWLYFVATAFVAVFTLSAGIGGIAITSALGFLAWRRYEGKARRSVTIAIVGIAALIALFGLTTMLVTVQPPGMGDIHLGSRDIKVWDGTRLDVWSTNRWRERPVTGVGYGELASNVTNPRCWTPVSRLDQVVGPQEPHPMDGHSVVLNILAQAGFVGLVTFVALVVALGRGVLWGRRDGLDREARLQRDLVASALVGAFLYHGIFGSFEESRFLWTLFALGVSLARLRASPPASATSEDGQRA